MRIEQVKVYRNREATRQTIRETILIALLGGQESFRVTWPDGQCCGEEFVGHSMLLFATPGTVLDFVYRTPRETWGVWLEEGTVRDHADTRFVEMLDEGTWLPLLRVKRLPHEEVPLWQGEFSALALCLETPHPANLFRARGGLLSLLRHCLPDADDGRPVTPGQMLRDAIDRDVGCDFTLEALSRRCGYSRDHLRDCFINEFGVTPREYRQRVRLARVMRLVRESRLSLKEIAERTGFRHLSHLSALFGAVFGYPPREALARFRRNL